jgi:hypothetical protein
MSIVMENKNQAQFSARLGALLPEDMVYEILTISGHGNWRRGIGTRNGRFIWRFCVDDPRLELLKNMHTIKKIQYCPDISGNMAINNYCLNLPIRGTNKYLQILTVVLQMYYNRTAIRYMIKTFDADEAIESIIYTEDIAV